MSSPASAGPTREQLEYEQLQQEVEKLRLEVLRLRRPGFWDVLSRTLGLVTALGAIASVWYGIEHYNKQQALAEAQFRQQQQTRDQERTAAENRRAEELRREAAKPFWDAQLKLYLKASEAAAVIARNDEKTRPAAEEQFWILYYGPLAIVEDVSTKDKPPAVARAMVEYGNYLRDTPPMERDRGRMQNYSFQLAHAMRDAAGPSFDLTPANLDPNRTKPKQ